MNFSSHPQWIFVKAVADKIQSRHHLTYLAGGCVRDGLLGVAPKDFDVATSASLQELEVLFPEALAVGKQFGILILPHPLGPVEVATFRSDGDYQDGRHPISVVKASPQEDAQRRDFTINALFLNLQTGEVIDFVDGQRDLQNRLIKTVGDAKKRFAEDHLRILRGVRFVSQLGFQLDPDTKSAMIESYALVAKVSAERVRDEMLKLLRGDFFIEGLTVLLEVKLYELFFSGPSLRETMACWQKYEFLVRAYKEDEEALWFYLFLPWVEGHSQEDPMPLLQKFRLPKNKIVRLRAQFQLWQRDWRQERFGQLLQVLSQKTSLWFLKIKEVQGRTSKDLLEKLKIKLEKPLAKPLLDGHVVMNLGFKGDIVGLILNESYCTQLEEEWSHPEEALRWLKNQWKES